MIRSPNDYWGRLHINAPNEIAGEASLVANCTPSAYRYNPPMPKPRSPLAGFGLTVLAILLMALMGPQEQSLGANVRIVYLHGAWVLTAEIAFLAPRWPGWQA